MSQGSLNIPTVGPVSPTAFAADINTALDAAISKNAGNSVPANFPTTSGGSQTAWMDWVNTTVAGSKPWNIFDGTQNLKIGVFDDVNHLWKPVVGGGFDTINSAATTDIGTKDATVIAVLGTTTINALGASATLGSVKVLAFAGILTLTNNANILLGSLSITTAANDLAVFVCTNTTGNGVWALLAYRQAAGRVPVSKLPTIFSFTSGGPLTYTPSTGVTRIRVRMCGGGGGGGAQSTNVGSTGNTTTFGSWTAVGGNGGSTGANGAGGTGGTGGAPGTGTLIERVDGMAGSRAFYNSIGGASAMYGVAGSFFSSGAATGVNAPANSGGGGSGGGTPGTALGGAGGGGEYVAFWVSQPGNTTYTVGAAANGGAVGTFAGGNGAAGKIVIEEFYD